MESLEEIIGNLYQASEETGNDIYIDSDVYEKEGFYVVVSESGKIGAFGIAIDEETEEEKNIYLLLNDKTIKYLNDEGFQFNDFYKAMGEKLFKFLEKEEFIKEMSE